MWDNSQTQRVPDLLLFTLRGTRRHGGPTEMTQEGGGTRFSRSARWEEEDGRPPLISQILKPQRPRKHP